MDPIAHVSHFIRITFSLLVWVRTMFRRGLSCKRVEPLPSFMEFVQKATGSSHSLLKIRYCLNEQAGLEGQYALAGPPAAFCCGSLSLDTISEYSGQLKVRDERFGEVSCAFRRPVGYMWLLAVLGCPGPESVRQVR
jgi:hypothetical protein